MKTSTSLFAFLVLFTFLFSTAYADIRLPEILSSDMVLQRGKEIKLWGWADENEKVKIKFNGQVRKTRADENGNWTIIFPALEAGGPYEIQISGKNEIRLENILIGDVWICSGQSNMAWNVKRSDNAEEEIRNAGYPEIRLLHIDNNFSYAPADDVPETRWKVCDPESVPAFSAVGYFFGRHIHRETGVPVGLISTSWGGTNIEAWTSSDYITTIDVFKEKLESVEILDEETIKLRQEEVLSQLMKDFGLDFENPVEEDWSAVNVDYDLWKLADVPGLWEKNGLPDIDGTVWYRKEFDLPADIAEKGITLHLGKIDDTDETWVNGIKVGGMKKSHNKPRIYKVSPEILKPGKNVIAVRVEDYSGSGGFRGGPDVMSVKSEDYTQSLAGEWKYRLTAENFVLKPGNSGSPNDVPSSLYNGMIHPLLALSVKGAIWYQGESNAGRAYQYRKLMPLLIECWRDKWEQPNMPFIMVQLANFMEAGDTPEESAWAELREAQLMTLDKLENVGMAVAIDIGESDDIHPRNKQDVGYRLALNALKIAYDRDLVYQGPVYESVEFTGGKAIISFTHKGSGLIAKDKYGYLMGFTVAGEDGKFHWAKAKIENGKVIVFSEKVENPVAVRYGWANNPEDANLYNKEGLPASPFRTDEWKGITFAAE